MILIVTTAVFYDWKRYRIPNVWILLGYIFACLFCFREGAAGAGGLLAGAMIPVFCLMLFRKAGILGGGDVKLLSVAGAFLGIREGLLCMAASFCIGAFLSLLLMLQRRIFKTRICFFLNYIQTVIRTGKWSPYYNIARDGYKGTMHFSTAIMLAVWFVLWYCR